ncbi:Zinc finger PMZ-type [Arabidopsis thaliana x Arabidopsis arenosa]|uniref:Zinc finger PMZ-type n=1 Tax=Arabidopsis thaliana x Arabidopsis arenosa TaxID=1240361 RepID=A0A8T1Z2P7_9BRAS|nr:Zinc finger PMZ-type [Arabidopsis thaliana x Arabidopsis arenosa]
MSIMIERTRPPVYIDNQMSLDTFFLIRVGDPSVNLFVSFSKTVDATTNADVDEQTDVQDEKTNEDAEDDSDENIEIDDDASGGYSTGSTLDPTIDGSEGSSEDYNYNKWNDLIVEEYGVGHVEENVCDTPPTVEPAGEFSRLLEECTNTSKRVRTGEGSANLGDTQPTVNSTRTCQHGLLQCTYTRECVQDTGCEDEFVTYTDTDVNGRDEVNGEIGVDLDIGGSETGVLNETDLRIQPSVEAYEVYNGFSLLHSGEPEILDNDAAPVFDDLAKVRCDSTEVEISTTGETLYVGSVFMNRKVIQQTMSYLALKVCFCYKQTRSDPRRLEMVCVDENCRWHLSAKVVKNSECFKITRYNSIHTCDIDTRKGYTKHANYKLLGEVVKSRYSSTQGGPRAVDLPQLLLNDLNVRISYATAWRAKEVAVENVRGDDIKSYRFLPTYLYLLKAANPGTITHLHSTPEADGKQRFKYVFVALGASIKGVKYMRKVVVVDGTQLVGRYKGVLLIACAQDGNFQIFPIAFGVVDGETDASWVWFFDKLSEIVPDSEDLMIVSDRHSSIYKGLSVVYPKAHHGACVVHLERNISTYYSKYGFSGLFFSAAKAYRVRDFEKYFAELRGRSAGCANYLEEIGFEHWTRAHCKGERYNIMSSNNSESMNNVLTKAKAYPIVYMIEFIREVLMRWFAARRKKVAKCKSLVTPEVDERFLQDLPESGKFAVKMSGPWSYQVTSKSGEHFHVVLDECTCTCLRYTKLRIPCEHGLAAAIEFGINPKIVVGWWYSLQTFSDSFQEPILPIADPKDVGIPQNISEIILIPPHSRRPPGRPTSKRIPSRGENRGSRSRIEATIDRRLAPFYLDRLKENEWKIITSFSVRKNADPVKTTSHEYGIWFLDRTVVTNALRRDAFNFYDFTQFDYIIQKTVDKNVLVDAVGALLEVGGITEDFYGVKLPFKIKDRYNEVLECEAHNQQALDFQSYFRNYTRRNIVVALVCWRVTGRNNPKLVSHGPVSKLFADPDIPEVQEIKTVVY